MEYPKNNMLYQEGNLVTNGTQNQGVVRSVDGGRTSSIVSPTFLSGGPCRVLSSCTSSRAASTCP